jgi:hypothetical protein
MRWLLMVLIACSGSSGEGVPSPGAGAHPQGPPEGEQHPPIPAENEAWKDDRPGFRPAFFFYGERSWDDVKMRVLSQIAVIERDRARLAAMGGRPADAARIYAELHVRLNRFELGQSQTASSIRDLLAAAALRDSKLLHGVAAGHIPAHLRAGTESPALRAQLLHWTLSGTELPSEEQRAEWLKRSERLLLAEHASPGFSDFDDRHALRVALVSAHLQSTDPIGWAGIWGYWGPADARAQLEALRAAAVAPGAAGHTGQPAWQRSSHEIATTDPSRRFTAEGLGTLPTGDSLIDVAGAPGPTSIGKLARLGLDDPSHLTWLKSEAAALNQALDEGKGAVQARLQQTMDALDAHGHGSRFYNIKAARNEGVRVLARRGRYEEARAILLLNRPLHHQDWACPNRDGILRAIEGRLLAMDGDPQADAVLQQARQASEAFVLEVRQAEAAGH